MVGHVLIAEDSSSQRKVLLSLCRQIAGLNLYEAADGRWAARQAQKLGELDLVITDINMPGMDGIALIQELSRRHDLPSLLLLSGHVPELLAGCTKAAEALGFPCIAYMTKPINPDEFIRTVNRLLEHKKCDNKLHNHFSLSEIVSGLAQNQFLAHYQPIYSQTEQRAVQIEALARWKHPTAGTLGPGTFIERLESDGFIVLLTRRIVQTSLDLLMRNDWAKDLKLSINLSRGILCDNDFLEWLFNEVENRKISPSRIVLEITETMAFHDLGNTLAALLRLRMKGFELSLDDFGTGHTNLEQLRDLPITELKLDRCLIKNISHDSRMQHILDGMIVIARDLGLRIVAEGIDNESDLAYLQENYPYIHLQGFLLSKPIAASDLLSALSLDTDPQKTA